MSLLIGPVSGALVAGGVYYGFSNLIRSRTEQHQRDLHALSVQLVETPALVQAPPSAASRIPKSPFASQIAAQWNQELRYLFMGFWSWDQKAQDWGRKLLYGRGNNHAPTPTQENQRSA